MGERRARWGYGYQDKVATERILQFLRKDLRDGVREFEGVRLADLEAGRVDDFVLVWKGSVEGNSIKWSGGATGFMWGDLVGASGLLQDLACGWNRLRSRWTGRTVTVRLHTNRSVSPKKHHAQIISSFSVAEFVEKHWPSGPNAADSEDLREAWRKIAEHVDLAGPELWNFVANCELAFEQTEPPGIGDDSHDWRHYRRQFDSLHKAIATWLTNNPDGELIERDYLLAAIGLRSSRSGLIQRFPEPTIPYEKNHAAADRLKALVDEIPGGYLAITGPAGVGKSTLVQDVLTDSRYPHFVPYYAFLPSTDGNRDRAEALTFFQDVGARLERIHSKSYSLGITDIVQGRDALRRHMLSANQRYVLNGHKTILLIDGLDHAMREVDLQTPMLSELPHPDEIPEGFLIILSSQPQAFLPDVIPAAVATRVAEDGRRLEVLGLSRQEVHTLASKLGKPTRGEERDLLHDASQGNPLILTYLLAAFKRTDDTSVTGAIELAGRYAGQIDQYYHDRLAVSLQDIQTRKLLGLLCRAAPTLPVAWLAEWPEKEAIQDIYQRVLTPFVRVTDGRVSFIHDSLIAFLRSQTRSRLPGSDPVRDEREYHSILADRSYGRSCLDPVGRARVVHLMRANRQADVLEQLSSDWLRSAAHGFLPYAHVRPVLLAGHTAASAMGDWGHTLRLLLLSHELEQRTSRIDADHLADTFLDLRDPLLAFSQIRSDDRLLVPESEALRFAGTLQRYAHEQNLPSLKDKARTLYSQAKPISLIYTGEPIESVNHDEDLEIVRAWSSVAVLFEPPTIVTEEIQRLVLRSERNSHQPGPAMVRADLLLRAFDTALDAGCDSEELQVLVDAIQALGSNTSHFVALLRLAESMPSEVDVDSLQAAYGAARTNRDIDLAYARFLYHQDDRAGATEIIGRLSHIRFRPYEDWHRWGFSDVTYTTQLRWLQEILSVREGAVPGAKDESEEARARLEHTARELGVHLASAAKGQFHGVHRELFRSFLLFHNRPVHFSTLPRQHSIPQASRNEIYEQVVKLARTQGLEGLRALSEVVVELTTGSTAKQFTPYQRRRFAQLFYQEGAMSREQSVSLGLSSTADASDDDPMQRQEACLEIARFLYHVGDRGGSADWKTRASEVSAGAGSHKDYHMAQVADWLTRSIHQANPDHLVILDRFARAVEVAGGSGGPDGAAKLLRLIVRLTPARAWHLAVEYVDRDVLPLSEVLDALIAGGADASAHPELLGGMYGELLSLIAPGDTSETAAIVLRAFPRAQMREVATRVMAHVRTNALPSHRAAVARALQDTIRREGLDPITLTPGLTPGGDDAGGHSHLYRNMTGELETLDQVAERLSDPRKPDTWNPNPKDNANFYWWAAIGKARVADEAHFDSLVERFPPPDYRQIELMARRADILLRSGDRQSAKELIEKALSHSRDGSWHRQLDGAQKMTVFETLKKIDQADGIDRGREQFLNDLSTGQLWPLYLLTDIGEILELLAVDWPSDAVLEAVDDYLIQVLAASPETRPYESLTRSVLPSSTDQALCRFLAELLVCPVVDVGLAARRALAKYLAVHGKGFVTLFTNSPWWNPLQLEHLLATVHLAISLGSPRISALRGVIEDLKHSESLSVRSIAKRICDGQGWIWEDLTTASPRPIILVPSYPDTLREAEMVIGGETAIAWDLHRALIRPLLDRGLDVDELRSEFESVYWALKGEYPWASDRRLQHWVRKLLTSFWLNTNAVIGREAAMRVFGRQSLSGQIPPGAEIAYDSYYPIYDPLVESYRPTERPLEFQAMAWRFMGKDREDWLQGADASEWSHYPNSIQGRSVIGEQTWFVRPEWEWPREERYRGLIANVADEAGEQVLKSTRALTYKTYLNGWGQEDKQLVVLNNEDQLIGTVYRWAAINSNVAKALAWRPSTTVPFQWFDAKGEVMVESTFWKDGWIRIKPPRFESLGEGWVVSASTAAIEAIRRFAPETEIHLWVERHCHGDPANQGKWHLIRPL